MTKIDDKFGEKLKLYGAVDFNACYNCGTCTSVCGLSTVENSFPRQMVRCSVVGNQHDIQSSLKPWLCYYCGECSSNCPQTANPGELMMSLRRYLISKYDWTGISGLFFKSFTLSIFALLIIALGIIVYAYSINFDLSTMLYTGHYLEMFAILGVSIFILIPNILRMWWFTVGKSKEKINISVYFKSLPVFFTTMFTQKKALTCEDNKSRWFEHFILVIGYLSLLFTTVFLDWFSSANISIIGLGYLLSTIVFVITAIFMTDRIKKKKEVSKFSHPSDWFFVIGLFLMGFTAFCVRLSIDLNLIDVTKWVYVFHLIILSQWALIIVPFGKWTHFLYRSFAIYFDKLLTN